MSYSIEEAKMEFWDEVELALKKRDGDKLEELAKRVDESTADDLLATARRWEKEDDSDWDYDRWVDNNM